MNRLDIQEVKNFRLTDKWFALFYFVSSIIITITCIVYIVSIAGSNTWSHYYELPVKYQFWFVASIILIIISLIAFIGLLICISDGDCSRYAIICDDTSHNYYVSGRKVSKKEYDEEKTKYDNLIAPFIESLKPKKDI